MMSDEKISLLDPPHGEGWDDALLSILGAYSQLKNYNWYEYLEKSRREEDFVNSRQIYAEGAQFFVESIEEGLDRFEAKR